MDLFLTILNYRTLRIHLDLIQPQLAVHEFQFEQCDKRRQLILV